MTDYIPPEPVVIHRPGTPGNPFVLTAKGRALLEGAHHVQRDDCRDQWVRTAADLLHYGQHSDGCSFAADKLCTCGFTLAALAALRVA